MSLLDFSPWKALGTRSILLIIYQIACIISHIFMPPFEKGGHIALHLSVGMSVGRYVGRYVGRSVGMSVTLNLVQLITQ